MKLANALCVTAGIALAATPLAAQDSLARGARVRITAPSYGENREEGTLVFTNHDSVVVRFERGERVFPTVALTRLEVRTGSYAGTGSAIGIAAGVIAGLIVAKSTLPFRPCYDACWTTASLTSEFGKDLPVVGAGLALGAVVGGVLGGLIGEEFSTWEPARGWHVTPQVSFERGRPSLGLSLAF